VTRATVEIRPRGPRAVVLEQHSIAIIPEPILVRKSGEMSFTRAERADPESATLLLFDPTLNAFRPVLTPPGTAWELVEKQQGPVIWRPGMQS
jgi:hypothetical protein